MTPREALDSKESTDKLPSVSVQTVRTAQLRTYEFEEEKQAWMLLVRQAILDCQYLDKAAEECLVSPTLLSTSLATISSSSNPLTPNPPTIISNQNSAEHSATFASVILGILDSHNKIVFTRCVNTLITSFTFLLSTEIASICDMKMDQLGNFDTNPFGGKNAVRSRNNSSISLPSSETDLRSVCLYPDPYLARTAVGQRTAAIKNIIDRLGDLISTCFSDICSDYRPVIEIYSISTGVSSNQINGGEAPCFSSLLVKDFIDCVCGTLERTAGVSAGDFRKIWKSHNGNRSDENRFQVRSVDIPVSVCSNLSLPLAPSFSLSLSLSLPLSYSLPLSPSLILFIRFSLQMPHRVEALLFAIM